MNKSDTKTFNDRKLSRSSIIFSKENILSCMKKRLLDELNNHYNAAKMRDIMLIGTMMCLLLMCIIIKLATTDLYMNIKGKPLSLHLMKLLFYTTYVLHYKDVSALT